MEAGGSSEGSGSGRVVPDHPAADWVAFEGLEVILLGCSSQERAQARPAFRRWRPRWSAEWVMHT